MNEQVRLSVEQCIRDHLNQEDDRDAAITAASFEIVDAMLRQLVPDEAFKNLLIWAEHANNRLDFERDGTFQYGGNSHLNPVFKEARKVLGVAS